MKKLGILFLLVLALTGCSSLVSDTYVSVTPHESRTEHAGPSDAVVVETYLGLKNTILSMVREGTAEGNIHVTNYDGDVEKDLTEAVYEVVKLDPLGAYAVDYMTHSCTQIVSYYEIKLHITFRRSPQEIASIQTASTGSQLRAKVELALDNSTSRLTMRLSGFRDQDETVRRIVEEYCAEQPERVMEVPTVTISTFPENGSVRIMEVDFGYTHTAEELRSMRKAVRESMDAAAEYIRYRETDLEKARLLFTYLMERFQYQTGTTATPLYSALCEGVGDPLGLAQAWKLVSELTNVPCHVVHGMRNNQPYVWNVFEVDGFYRHLDLSRCMFETGRLELLTDEEMEGYYWNTDRIPACLPYPVEEPEPPAEPAGPTEPGQPEGTPQPEPAAPETEG